MTAYPKLATGRVFTACLLIIMLMSFNLARKEPEPTSESTSTSTPPAAPAPAPAAAAPSGSEQKSKGFRKNCLKARLIIRNLSFKVQNATWLSHAAVDEHTLILSKL